MIRLGVVGFGGRISGVINGVLAKLDAEVHVTGLVDPNEPEARARLREEDREQVVFYDTLDELVRKGKVDALAIGTRCPLHTPYAIQAAQYELPLFLEKPVSISMEQALALEAAFTGSRCPVVVSFPLRVSPICAMTRQLIVEGAVGTPQHVLGINYVNYGTIYFDADTYRHYDSTQGLFLQKATHDLDYLCYLMDSPITRVAAMAMRGRVFGGDKPSGLRCSACDETQTCRESPQNRRRNGSSLWADDDHFCTFSVDCGSPAAGMNEDASSALLEFASGAQGVYTQVFYPRRDAGRRGATVSGYEGTVSFDWNTNAIQRVRHHAPFSDVLTGGTTEGHGGGDHELCRDFLNLIHHRGESRATIWMGLQSVYTCLAAKESAERGCFMDVRQVRAACGGKV